MKQLDAVPSVVEFIRTFDASLDPKVWFTLVEEEFAEMVAEKPHTAAHLKEVADFIYVIAGYAITSSATPPELISERLLAKHKERAHNISPVADENIDFYSEEVLNEAFRRVHASNMSKLGEDGEPIRREDGKILKGPNYQPPDLTDLV